MKLKGLLLKTLLLAERECEMFRSAAYVLVCFVLERLQF